MSEDVKGGKYELIVLSWDELVSKPGDPVEFKRHTKGDIVTLNVEDANRLVRAGAVVKPGEREKSAAERLRVAAEAAQKAYDEALAKSAPDPEPPVAPVAVTPPPTDQSRTAAKSGARSGS